MQKLITAGLIIIIATGLAGVSDARAQKHFSSCTLNTGHSAVIIVPVDARLSIYGADIDVDDELAVFSSTGRCVGASIWNGQNMALAIWGDDPMTRAKEGVASGDTLIFRLWDVSEREEHGSPGSILHISFNGEREYFTTAGRYRDDAIYVLSSLSVGAGR